MYKVIRHLSIDVAIGASAMMALVAGYFHAEVEPIYFFLLSLMTWLIYTTDHLMDARNIPHEAHTPRHRFHQVHYKAILSTAIVGIFIFVALIPRQTEEMLIRMALGLSALILLYFLSLIWARITQFRFVLKELFIAACYTTGVSIVPIFHTFPLSAIHWLFLILIFFLALANLFLFSVREMQPDIIDNNPSAIRFLGLKNLRFLLQVILWLQLIGDGFLVSIGGDWQFPLLLILMNAVLMLLFYLPAPFRKNENYRVLGDGIFLIPVIYFSIKLLF